MTPVKADAPPGQQSGPEENPEATQQAVSLDDKHTALAAARELAEHGVPLFLARPAMINGSWDPHGGHHNTGYTFPTGWQRTVCDPGVVDDWRPGMALCAVMGHGVDLLDIDTHKGGGVAALNGTMPTSYGRTATPSGGTHDLIAGLGQRSRDGVLPGIDVKSGTVDGEGRGFAFLPPTMKASKIDGTPRPYRWLVPPHDLTKINRDTTGDALGVLLTRPEVARVPAYTGPDYDALSGGQRVMADAEVERRITWWRDRLTDAADWPEGETDDKGRGWEALTRDCAWSLALLAAAPWTGIDQDQARELYAEVVPAVIRADPKCAGKWTDATLAKAAAAPVDSPPWDGLDVVDDEPKPDPAPDLADSVLAEWTANEMRRRFCWAAGLGWLRWDGRVWADATDASVTEVVRQRWRTRYASEVTSGCTPDRARALNALLGVGKLRAVVGLLRGLLERRAEAFDAHPDLLTVGNGTVDLRTGSLGPHNPDLLLTKATPTKYLADARHDDWARALEALPAEVGDWMQVRIGQAATGHSPDDDVLPVLKGGGSNGKSTIVEAVTAALGDHAVTVPERLLLANPGDHPTELTTLRGARLAVLEEAPEGRRLSVKRLKDTVGTPTITARRIRQDNVTWSATHSLFLTTNYPLSVAETDHGTWRRLALVRFPYRYRKPHEPSTTKWDRPESRNLRSRMKSGRGGRAEAVLAWIVDGARTWYSNDRTMPAPPPPVRVDTEAWRCETDHVLRFVSEVVEFDPAAMVLATELYDAFNDWHTGRHWSVETFTARFGDHDAVTDARVEKTRTRNLTGLSRRFGGGHPDSVSARVWTGVRFRPDGAL